MEPVADYEISVEMKDGTQNKHFITVDTRRPRWPQIDNFLKMHYGRSKMMVREVTYKEITRNE